jgi:hypothetical protein
MFPKDIILYAQKMDGFDGGVGKKTSGKML